MEKEIKVLMEQGQRNGERIDNVINQLDKDRGDLDRVRVDVARISTQQDTILKTMADFKAEVRQTIQDSIRQEVAKAVKKELEKIGLENPKKVFFVQKSIIQRIKNKFKKHAKQN